MYGEEKQDIKKWKQEEKWRHLIKEKMMGMDRREGIQVEREKESNQHKSKGERRDVMMISKKHVREV